MIRTFRNNSQFNGWVQSLRDQIEVLLTISFPSFEDQIIIKWIQAIDSCDKLRRRYRYSSKTLPLTSKEEFFDDVHLLIPVMFHKLGRQGSFGQHISLDG